MKRLLSGLFALILVLSVLVPALPARAESAAETPTTVGAIRWDAWYGHDGRKGSVISQVEKSLSPAKYHFRAPFFARVTDEGTIEIPEYTQEIFDREMEYAIEAGIDYFAYVWYNNDMKAAREFHTKSRYREKVKLCVCFDNNAINQSYARKEMETLWKENCYMKIDGRPLMYYYAGDGNLDSIRSDIAYYKKLAEKLGMKEPYVVLMNRSPEEMRRVGADALSRYSATMSGGVPFAEFADAIEQNWENWRLAGAQIVPNVSFGWHTGPRYDNPVSWMTVSEDTRVAYGTKDELKQHLENALNYLRRSDVQSFTRANTVIMYAWNEHDEGGWICPTLAVDENGDPLYGQDGKMLVNDEHLQAVKEAIASVRGAASTPNAAESAATEPAKIEAPGKPSAGKDHTTENVMYSVCGAIVLIVCAAAIVRLIRRSRKR